MLRPRSLLLFLLSVLQVVVRVRAGQVEEAVCRLDSVLRGEIRLKSSPSQPLLEFSGQIAGLSPGKHGFHVHEHGNLTEACKAAGGHYNPRLVDHGDRNGTDRPRHAGDFGNIVVEDNNDISYLKFTSSSNSTLDSLLGRAIVVHAKEDDLGLGGTDESRKTGSAGARLDCCIITSVAASQAGPEISAHHILILLSTFVRFIVI